MAVTDVTMNPFCTVFPFDYLGQLYLPGLLSLPGRCSVDIYAFRSHDAWHDWAVSAWLSHFVFRYFVAVDRARRSEPQASNLFVSVIWRCFKTTSLRRKYSGISPMIHFPNDHWQCQDPDWVAFLKINTLIAASFITIYCGSTWIYIYWGSESFRWRFGLFWFALVH